MTSMGFKRLNLFEPIVDQHYKVVSHEFDVFGKFRICANLSRLSKYKERIRCLLKLSNLVESLLNLVIQIRKFHMILKCFKSFKPARITS